MYVCKFDEALSKLRKSSKDAIDDTETFNEFKKYIHVKRDIETHLKKILKHINNSNQKSLVLLCGSAGDGKSHLLSYLKNNDSENLLSSFIIYNDGTESASPDKTAVDTLNELLNDFADENLNNNIEPSKSIILAINLGVLNNFIDSKYGKRYGLLRNYVYEKEILTSNTNNDIISDNPYFQSINFSDYHLFNLNENGINVVFIDSMMDKVFGENDDSPFYQKYISNCCHSCTRSKCCAVKHNFEFLKSKKCQEFIANSLVECIIKEKLILTTREFQNFIFDIIVPIDFHPNTTLAATDQTRRIDAYLKSMTPSLLFDQKDCSPLLSTIKISDPITKRSEKNDEEAIDFYVKTSVEQSIKNEFNTLPYKDFLFENQVMQKISIDKTYRSKLFSIIKRCQSFTSANLKDTDYQQFLRYLYYYNANNINKLDSLYEQVEFAVKQWCGTDEDDNLCIEANELGYKLYEEINFDVYEDDSILPINNNELNRFTNYICVKFQSKNDENSFIPLVIDYSLYELITKLNKGYIQTSESRNNHADFLTFIKKIKNNGNSNKKVIVTGPNGLEMIFQKKKLGYTFKNKGD